MFIVETRSRASSCCAERRSDSTWLPQLAQGRAWSKFPVLATSPLHHATPLGVPSAQPHLLPELFSLLKKSTSGPSLPVLHKWAHFPHALAEGSQAARCSPACSCPFFTQRKVTHGKSVTVTGDRTRSSAIQARLCLCNIGYFSFCHHLQVS